MHIAPEAELALTKWLASIYSRFHPPGQFILIRGVSIYSCPVLYPQSADSANCVILLTPVFGESSSRYEICFFTLLRAGITSGGGGVKREPEV